MSLRINWFFGRQINVFLAKCHLVDGSVHGWRLQVKHVAENNFSKAIEDKVRIWKINCLMNRRAIGLFNALSAHQRPHPVLNK